MYAIGFKVLSEEYSNPSLIILTSFGFPSVVDFGTMYAPVPFSEFEPVKIGNFLYPVPPEIISILSIAPCADFELVDYSKTLHSLCEYDNFSGITFSDMLKVVDPIPDTL